VDVDVHVEVDTHVDENILRRGAKRMENYYGTRRKRNIDLSRYRQPNSPSAYWDEDSEVEVGYEYEEVLEYEEEDKPDVALMDEGDASDEETEDPGHNTALMLNGKPFVLKQQATKQSFNDTHVRVTTYLEKNVHQIIKMLLAQNQIESITKFINDSVKDHLMNKYHNDN